MSNHDATPEIADRHRLYLVLAMFTTAVITAANAAERVVGPETVELVKILQLAMVPVLLLLVMPMAVWKMKNRDQSLRFLYLDESGYVAQSIQQAKNVSWIATFVFLVTLPPLARRLEGIPGEFFLYLSTTVMLVSFVVAFFLLNRTESDEGDEGGQRASTRA